MEVTTPSVPTQSFLSATNGTINNGTLEFDATRTAADTFGVINLAPGDYQLQLLYFEGASGAGVELFAAPGAFTAFNSATFDLVRDAANGGLVLVPEPATTMITVGAGVGSLGLGRRSHR